MPKTILLADDSVTIQKVVGITFANEDVDLVTADNGDEALVKAREIKPDVILHRRGLGKRAGVPQSGDARPLWSGCSGGKAV